MNKDYLHNFACWAAARAVQNPHHSGTSTAIIRQALDDINIYSYVEDPTKLLDYKNEHIKIVNNLLEKLGWDKDGDRYGVATKIIAIYFKVAVIIPGKASSSIIKGIYPPIDSLNLSKIKGFSNYKWTKLNKDKYEDIITALDNQLKNNNSSFIDFEAENTFIIK
jgi:hypothetical protein